MQKITSQTFHPFSVRQLMYLDAEIQEAGNFDLLMRKKEALQYRDGCMVIVPYDKEEYKAKYITGIYETLRMYYHDQTPYTFWMRMYLMLRKAQRILV
ncbi:MAG: hypothetical protein HY063_05915 [Bacteroidetes bacterium]|nr:hypothetical protein [Bacteroidota bacterium]